MVIITIWMMLAVVFLGGAMFLGFLDKRQNQITGSGFASASGNQRLKVRR